MNKVILKTLFINLLLAGSLGAAQLNSEISATKNTTDPVLCPECGEFGDTVKIIGYSKNYKISGEVKLTKILLKDKTKYGDINNLWSDVFGELQISPKMDGMNTKKIAGIYDLSNKVNNINLPGIEYKPTEDGKEYRFYSNISLLGESDVIDTKISGEMIVHIFYNEDTGHYSLKGAIQISNFYDSENKTSLDFTGDNEIKFILYNPDLSKN